MYEIKKILLSWLQDNNKSTWVRAEWVICPANKKSSILHRYKNNTIIPKELLENLEKEEQLEAL